MLRSDGRCGDGGVEGAVAVILGAMLAHVGAMWPMLAQRPPTMQTKHPGAARVSSIIWAYVGPC